MNRREHEEYGLYDERGWSRFGYMYGRKRLSDWPERIIKIVFCSVSFVILFSIIMRIQ